MKKLLLQSSFLIAVLAIVLFSCKAKKALNSTESAKVVSDEEVVETHEDSTIYIIDQNMVHKPGTINQKELDSIKAVRMKEKRQYKK